MERKHLANVVDSWLGEGAQGNDGGEGAYENTARPARLGLGAKFIPHVAAAKDMEQKLKKRIVGLQRARKGDEDEDVTGQVALDGQESGSEEEESRTSAAGRKGHKRSRSFSHSDFLSSIQHYAALSGNKTSEKRKKKKQRLNQANSGNSVPSTTPLALVTEPPSAQPKGKKNKRKAGSDGADLANHLGREQTEGKTVVQAGGEDHGKANSTGGESKSGEILDNGEWGVEEMGGEGGEGGDVPREKRKRKKSRSKQKGIRRDTRPEDKRPNYRVVLPKPPDGKNRPNNWLFANLSVDPRAVKRSPHVAAKHQKNMPKPKPKPQSLPEPHPPAANNTTTDAVTATSKVTAPLPAEQTVNSKSLIDPTAAARTEKTVNWNLPKLELAAGGDGQQNKHSTNSSKKRKKQRAQGGAGIDGARKTAAAASASAPIAAAAPAAVEVVAGVAASKKTSSNGLLQTGATKKNKNKKLVKVK
eukprot:gb/GEZN01008235.1/.p1 GENE.gb/GEZN01008235.1/~~gb/GEZN01008235.1/.p1  ORF type:complete len:473 (+),score=88.19 gb/GEZN01008235.1/:34-1452(+)